MLRLKVATDMPNFSAQSARWMLRKTTFVRQSAPSEMELGAIWEHFSNEAGALRISLGGMGLALEPV